MEKKLYEKPIIEIISFAAKENLANENDNLSRDPWADPGLLDGPSAM